MPTDFTGQEAASVVKYASATSASRTHRFAETLLPEHGFRAPQFVGKLTDLSVSTNTLRRSAKFPMPAKQPKVRS